MNFVPMVGHSTVRSTVMGDDYEREATGPEIARMQELVRQGMEAGAWGLGAGVEYRPARFSKPRRTGRAGIGCRPVRRLLHRAPAERGVDAPLATPQQPG